MQLIQSQQLTMSSDSLLEIINAARTEAGEPEIRRNKFAEKIEDELEGEHYTKRVVQNLNKTESAIYDLTRDQCMLVSMRESRAVRRSVLEKLNKLDDQQSPQFNIPTTLSGALRLAAEQAETIEAQQLLIEQQKPSVEFVESYVEAEGLMGFRQVAKLLGANERKFRQMLLDESVMYYLGGVLTPMAAHINAGRFEVKTGEAGNGHAFTSAKFTPKGVEYVSRLWRASNE